jgi:hypothetical protein
VAESFRPVLIEAVNQFEASAAASNINSETPNNSDAYYEHLRTLVSKPLVMYTYWWYFYSMHLFCYSCWHYV